MTTTLASLLAAAEPTTPRPIGELIARLRAAGEDLEIVALPGSDAASAAGTPVHGVTSDSRAGTRGALFVAIPGLRSDGHAFAAAAIRTGAAALLVERRLDDCPVPQLVVRRTRPLLAEAAAWWYGDPSRELGVVGVTGTDGKTTTSHLAAAALARAGIPSGLLGTVATQIGGVREANPEHGTTPEAPALQRILRAMVLAGDRAAVLETTSHGLALDRVGAVDYDVAILTNLTHEHLELHGTFEAYRAAKVSLFERLAITPAHPAKPVPGWPRAGIVNADDPSAPAFTAAALAAGARLITYGWAAEATIRITGVRNEDGGLVTDYAGRGRPRRLRLGLAGRFNARNAAAVVALGLALELDPAAVDAGIESVEAVPGRMERIERGQPFDVVVDFAHTPASLALVLDELAPAAAARGGGLIAVFGSAGERDTAKRPLMGRVAGERCRLVIVTDEDPRGEDREAIVRGIADGARAAAGSGLEAVEEIVDRPAAIREAFRRARPGDTVLLAGKGHEPTIEGPSGDMPWNEAAEAAAALAELGWTG